MKIYVLVGFFNTLEIPDKLLKRHEEVIKKYLEMTRNY